jgi:4-amino-4-deoxy-L-arabinose transferase-like glycosyltransferase
LAGIICLALIWRIVFLFWVQFDLDADEAVVGLMAKHISEASAFPIWFYGQPYMGAVEAYLTAPLMWLLGPNALAVKMSALLFALAYVFSGWLLARRILGKGVSAVFCAIYLAAPPLLLLLWSVKLRGGFVSVLALGQFILWLAHVIATEGATKRRGFFLGLLCGLAIWINLLVLPYLLAAGLYLMSRRKLISYVPAMLLCLTGLLIGAAPFWIYNLFNSGATFVRLLGGDQGSLLEHLANIFGRHIPILLGEFPPWQEASTSSWLGIGIRVLFGLGLLVFLYFQRKSLARFFCFSRKPTSGAEMYVLTALGFLLAAAFTHFGSKPEPRYAIVLYSLLAPICGVCLGRLWELSRSTRWLAGLLVLGLVTFNLSTVYRHDYRLPTKPVHYVRKSLRLPIDLSPVYKTLELSGVSAVEADYWIGQLINFETSERIVALTRPQRIADYITRFQAADRHAWIYNRPGSRQRAARKARELATYGIMADVLQVSGLHIVLSWDEGQKPQDWRAKASHGQETSKAFDRNQHSRWTSGLDQHVGQWFELDLGDLRVINGLGIISAMGDTPRQVCLQTSVDGETYQDLTLARPALRWHFRFDPRLARFVRLTLTESRDRWWSIVEMYVYGH